MTKKDNYNDEKFNRIVENVRKPVLIAFSLVIFFVAAFSIFKGVEERRTKRQFERLDKIVTEIDKVRADLQKKEADEAKADEENAEESEKNDEAKTEIVADLPLSADEEKAIADLKALAEEGGAAVAMRANLACADIYFDKHRWNDAKAAYEAAISAQQNQYTTGIAYYNLAAVCEELGDSDAAKANYEKACEQEGFLLVPHTMFNRARINITQENWAEAAKIIGEMLDKYPEDSWTDIARSALIKMQVEGRVEVDGKAEAGDATK